MNAHSVEMKLKELAAKLPPAPPKGGVYRPIVQQGKLLYISGQSPVLRNGSLIQGKVGKDLNADEGKQAARQVGLTMLSTIQQHFGSPAKIKRLIKLFGMVNATSNFTKHPHVINGCSELFVDLWGEQNGTGARSAIGMGSLPHNMAVEIEAVFEIF